MKHSKNAFQIALVVISILLLSANIVLILQNLTLRSQLAGSAPIKLKEGDSFDHFSSTNLAGEVTNIDYSLSDRNILMFFRTSCGYSQKQMKFWRKLTLLSQNDGFTITLITTENDVAAIQNYLTENRLENWNVLMINATDAEKAKLQVTPITVVVDREGIVSKVWTGMWQPDDLKSASKYFSVDFSG